MPFAKTILWMSLSIFFGLLQVWVIYLASTLSQRFPFDMTKILVDGTLLFFSSGLVASIAIDLKFDNNVRLSRLAEGFLFLFPTIILVMIAVAYVTIIFNEAAKIKIENVRTLQYLIIVASTSYTFIVKAIQYTSERKSNWN